MCLKSAGTLVLILAHVAALPASGTASVRPREPVFGLCLARLSSLVPFFFGPHTHTHTISPKSRRQCDTRAEEGTLAKCENTAQYQHSHLSIYPGRALTRFGPPMNPGPPAVTCWGQTLNHCLQTVSRLARKIKLGRNKGVGPTGQSWPASSRLFCVLITACWSTVDRA